MNYHEFVKDFVNTEKSSVAFTRNNYIFHVLKAPLGNGVYALYGGSTFVGRSKIEKEVNPSLYSPKNMARIAFIDSKGVLRFTTFDFWYDFMGERDPVDVSSEKEVLGALMKQKVKEKALSIPLPESLMTKQQIEEEACLELFSSPTESCFNSSFVGYITEKMVVEYLAFIPTWADDAIEEWSETSHFGGKTNIERMRESLADEFAVKKRAEEIQADPNHMVHKYLKMKEALGDAKNVIVDFLSPSGKIIEAKFPTNMLGLRAPLRMGDLTHIEAYGTAPYSKVEELKEAFGTSFVSKDNIASIRFRGKKIWEKGNI